jgi:hypothetical protein
VLSDLNRYTQYKTAEAIGDAARNPSGMAGMGAGIGAGMAVGQQMAQNIGAAQSGAAAPPPLPGAIMFYAAINGAQAGPFDMATLTAKIREGQIARNSLVWKQGMANWAAADSVQELQALFASMPPPLPPKA